VKLGELRLLIGAIFAEHGPAAVELDVTVRAVIEATNGDHFYVGTIETFEVSRSCGDGELYVAVDCSDADSTVPSITGEMNPQTPMTPLERRVMQNLHLDQGPPPPGMPDLLERNLGKLSLRLAAILLRDNFPDTLEAASTLTSVGLIGLRDMGVPLVNAHELVAMTYANGTLVQATDDQLARAGLTPPPESRDYCICGLKLPRHMAEVAPKRITFTHTCTCARRWRWHHAEKTWTTHTA
jgi:hypothetical protein